jgi:hypothetical protein
MSEFITVKIARSEIQKMLTALINSPHKEIMAKAICEGLAGTEMGLQNLYSALQGIDRVFKYKVGEVVLMKENSMYSWRVDKPKMIDNGMIRPDGYVQATVVSIHPHRSNPYTLSYKYINKDNGAIETNDTTPATEEDLMTFDDYPLGE